MRAVAKSIMRKGFLIFEEMRKYLTIYEEAVSHIWLCNRSLLNFLIYEENSIFFFYQCGLLWISAGNRSKRKMKQWHLLWTNYNIFVHHLFRVFSSHPSYSNWEIFSKLSSLKNWPVKVLGGMCLFIWGPLLGFCFKWWSNFVGSDLVKYTVYYFLICVPHNPIPPPLLHTV